MKKFIFMMIAMLMLAVGSVNAQTQSNYAGSSKFTDNISVTLQGGVVTPFTDFFKNGSTTPVVVLGVEKGINPWFAVELEGRTSIGTGDKYNPHTAFDMVNISGYAKFNVLNLIDNLNGASYSGQRRFFEPVVYTGLGWNHVNCSDVPSLSQNYNLLGGVPTEHIGVLLRNSVSYRAGVEFNFNIGKDKAWGVVVNPSVVWANIDNGRLCKANGNFEVTAGVVYRFKTSNGTRTFAKAKLYDQAEIDALNKRIAELEARPAKVVTQNVEVVKEVPAVVGVPNVTVMFELGKADLSDKAKAELDKIGQNAIVNIDAYASPEGGEQYNLGLSEQRKNVVKAYLEDRGVRVNEARFHGAEDKYSNRVAIVTLAGPVHPNGFNPHPHGHRK